MKFEWDNDEWVEGDSPKSKRFQDYVREHPWIFFLAAINAFLLMAKFGGKVVMWFIKLIVEG